MQPTIEDVRKFWDAMPLGVGFIQGEVGSKEWFQEFDRIKADFGLFGVLDDFAPASLRGKRVLDVGCGPGFWARHLSRLGADYVGIDISPRSATLARRSLELHGLRGRIEVGNAESLPFDDESFDAVISEGVIHHTPDTMACIGEIHRVLKNGGRAAVSVYHRGPALRSPLLFAITQRAMRAANFGLRGRGREGMAAAPTAEEFVRMYDGAANPIGKAYTTPEFRRAFEKFSSATSRRYFIPLMAGMGAMPAPLRRGMTRAGLMVLVVAHK
jgi:ubiquinone/menaquinone biosynthesis C-methylase UbiE